LFKEVEKMKVLSTLGIIVAALLLSSPTAVVADSFEESVEREPFEPQEPREMEEPTDIDDDLRAEPRGETQEEWPGPGYVSEDLREDDEVIDFRAGDAPAANGGTEVGEEMEEQEEWPGPGYVSPELE